MKKTTTHKRSITASGVSSGFSTYISGVFIFAFLAISLWLIFEYAEKERNRDLINWQSRLALLAEIRAKDVEEWVNKKANQLDELANNSSIRLFLSQSLSESSVDKSILSAQHAHVRNLMSISAAQFELTDAASGQLNLNLKSDYGLAVLGVTRQLVMSTKGFPVDLTHSVDVIEDVYETAKTKIIDIHSSSNQNPVYGFVSPVFQIQDINKSTPIGAVVVLLDPREKLYELLVNRQSSSSTDESILIKQKGPNLVYISPINHPTRLFHQLPDNNNILAASYAYHNVGNFIEMKDYRGDNVLITARDINNAPWRLVQKISADEALAESNRHQVFLLTTFTIFVFFVSALFIAIWRHSTSLRLRELSEVLETRTVLLDAVTENIQEKIILMDKDARIIFINDAFSNVYGVTLDEVVGRPLGSVISIEAANQIEKAACGENNACVVTLAFNNNNFVYHITMTRLTFGGQKDARLLVLHDISELKQEQERRDKLGRGIITTLVKAVDLHDPYCANHSERTREVAVEIAKEMDLSKEQQEALELAALLANIGKLFVPKDVLTKMEPLTDAESAQLRKHIEYAVDILSGLTFAGPVIEIISQKNERMDGSGYPKGLVGEEILLESRILAVANTFVAMASSRAYREGREVRDVVNSLLKQSEFEYDRHIVAALFHIAENKTNWGTWRKIDVG